MLIGLRFRIIILTQTIRAIYNVNFMQPLSLIYIVVTSNVSTSVLVLINMSRKAN